jgi:ribosomal-protein-alanine N-acetyltransferase
MSLTSTTGKRTGKPPAVLAAGDRVFLRAPTSADRHELARVGAEGRTLHHPWVTPPATPEETDRWITGVQSERSAAFVICRHEDAAIVGVFSLSEIVRGVFQSCYASYYAHAAFARRGYMREGLELLLRHVFGAMRLHRVEANIQPGNAASIALVRRTGFRFEGHSPRYLKIRGRWRDHERWAITREDWLRATGR